MGYFNTSLCLTPECVQTASTILQYMAPNYQALDPCEDFDQYVCGGYPSRFPERESSAPLDEKTIDNAFIIKTVLDAEYHGDSNKSSKADRDVFQLLQDNYRACMDASAIEAETESSARAIFSDIMGLFPVSDSEYIPNATYSVNDYEAWSSLQAYLSFIDIHVLYKYSPLNNYFENTTTYVPSIDPRSATSLGSQNATQLSSKLQAIFVSDTARNASDEIAQGVVNLEAQLQSAIQLITSEYGFLAGSDNISSLPVELSVSTVMKDLAPAAFKLEKAIIPGQKYFANISAILKATPKATIQAYSLLLAESSLSSVLLVDDTQTDIQRFEKVCSAHIDKTMGWIASKVFVDAAYSDGLTSFVDTIVEDLRSAFMARIDANKWMTDAAKKIAKEKAKAIKKNIAYPKEVPNVKNATDLLEFYEGYTVSDSHFNNTMQYRQLKNKRNWNQLVKPTPEWDSSNHAYIVNAQYNPLLNSMFFPAGILQNPFFSTGIPQYLAYGGFGAISGHEITHGFDAQGSLFDKNGLLVEAQYDNKTTQGFLQRTKCFIEQYSNHSLHADFPIQGSPIRDPKTNSTLHVNGEKTLNENIADAGGVATAYTAWLKRRESEPQNNPKLPGLDNFTPEQLFFVSFGQLWCHRQDAKGLITQVSTDVHAPNQSRNRGMTENSAEFKKAFNCKKKEPVCEMW
ncbi:hypothetical protein JX265_010304 [Neoarthrinium moseri]|uniref:Endothelin-converting enzyme 1 n=1 Tax=Neoarthrinium moseri TaxID=1658444 RepID=A0A9P9WEZ5_9PEZI|nr:hypothetical protein JX265_010304 [Neoarthrinium moseri]